MSKQIKYDLQLNEYNIMESNILTFPQYAKNLFKLTNTKPGLICS